jgi:succinyl-CoA synthetase alpha subunit
MASLSIILLVTADIYGKVKIPTSIKMYSNDEKTDMILIYGECNKNASAVARLCRQ